jgi:hypothetical protein
MEKKTRFNQKEAPDRKAVRCSSTPLYQRGKAQKVKSKEMHGLVEQQGIRLFALSLGADRSTFIHSNKTVKEWREDIRRFIAEISHRRERSGRAEDEVFNQMMSKLDDAGYIEVTDIVADVYEGRIAAYSAGVEDNPAHEERADGFGHYGWESKDEI